MKWIESAVRNFSYFLFRITLRNKQVALPLDIAAQKKILILRYDVLGDMIVTTPVFHLLHTKAPNCELHVLGTPRNVGVLAHDKRISKVLRYEGTFRSLLELRRIARREKYDCVIAMVFYKATKAGLWANWLSGRRATKITWANPKRAHLYTALFNAQLPASPNDHTMSEIHVKFLCDTFGWEYRDDLVQLSIALSTKNRDYAEQYYRQFLGAPTLLINTTAGNSEREMTSGTVRELVGLLRNRYPRLHLLLNVAPSEKEKYATLYDSYPSNVHILPYSEDVLDFCAVVSRSSAVISPDTAIIHIAAAFMRPIVGIYKNSVRHAKQWGPQHGQCVLVLSDDGDDLRTVTSRRIVAAFEQLTNQYPIV
ncbi:MAG: glycosyltransferase family 9 protein [Candidatus Kapaibacterium sp.]